VSDGLDSNKVFFFSGILPICGDDNGIATVLSHEIAHNVCHHAAEQMSSSLTTSLMWAGTLLLIGIPDIWTLLATDYMLSIAFRLPRSREMESEADQVGLRLMALSCYDPRAATTFWQRMEQAQLLKPPEFMSTHPSGETRIRQLGGWMEDAYKSYGEQNCPSQMSK
jgi:predicted Zn-dependent protease